MSFLLLPSLCSCLRKWRLMLLLTTSKVYTSEEQTTVLLTLAGVSLAIAPSVPRVELLPRWFSSEISTFIPHYLQPLYINLIIWCLVDPHLLLTWSWSDPQSIHTRSSFDPNLILIWSSLDPHLILTRSSSDLHSILIWSSFHPHLIFIGSSSGLHWILSSK